MKINDFIYKAKIVHGDKYSYEKSVYTKSSNKIVITCKKHGDFYQIANNHLKGKGCKECSITNRVNNRKLSIQDFIDKSNKIHNNKYDYSLVNYINNYTKVQIICPNHGVFFKSPNHHFHGSGCNKCTNEKISRERYLGLDEFIKRSKEKHGDVYDYSKVEYINNNKKINIICYKHGIFKQSPSNHMIGHGCNKCSRENNNNSWSYSEWMKKGMLSKNFKGFKFYIIKCWNHEEIFYKIGKTYTDIYKRFGNNLNNKMPYYFEIIKLINGSSKEISVMEENIKKQNKNNFYVPKIKFNGYKECFSYLKKEEYYAY